MSFKGLKKLSRLASRNSGASNDSESTSAPVTPASEVPSTDSPVSTPPTSPNPDASSGQSNKRPGLFGRTSSLVKGKVPSIPSVPSFGLPKSASSSEDNGSGGLGLLSSTITRAGTIADNLTPSISMPTMPFSLSSLPLADTLEMITGSTSLDGFGMSDILSSAKEAGSAVGIMSHLPTGWGGNKLLGMRGLERARLKAGEISEDVLQQAIGRRKQIWKRVIILASGLAPPDSLFRIPGRGASFVLKPDTRGSVPLQWLFRGVGTIDDTLANRLCVSFTVDELLAKLNDVAGTKYTPNEPGLGEVLQACLDRSYDFGYAYGMLRPVWSNGNFVGLLDRWEELEAKDKAMRDKAIQGETIVTPRIPPRRVWDLYSNRVLPFWAIAKVDQLQPDGIPDSDPEEDESEQGSQDIPASEKAAPLKDASAAKEQHTNIPSSLWAVSHAWAHDDDRKHETTIINGHKWPVPLHKETHLDRVRIELLNFGAKYAWLDVLCLNQNKSSKDEELKAECEEEWKLDVPTIGHIYQHDRYQTVITYFNGLGRPFVLGPNIIRGERYWINRVWTLQETTPMWLPGGMTLALFDKAKYGDVVRPGLFEQVQRLCQVIALHPPDIFAVLGAVRDRSYSGENDRVGAVGYLLKIPTVPTFIYGEEVEKAWERLLFCLSDKHRTDILVLYPTRGDHTYWWAPSWYQLMGPEPPSVVKIPYNSALDATDHDWKPKLFLSEGKTEFVRGIKNADGSVTYYHHAYVIEFCNVRLTGSRNGKILIQTVKNKAVEFKKSPIPEGVTQREYDMNIDHKYPIPPGNYTLVGVARLKYWVLGKRVDPKGEVFVVDKLSVIRMHDEARNRMIRDDPGIAGAKVVYK